MKTTRTERQELDAPFDSMTDRQIVALIKEWASEAPEDFYMDGETKMSRRRLIRYHLTRWRAMPTDDQQRLIDRRFW